MSVFNVELKKVVDDSYDIEIGYNLMDKLVEDMEAGLFGTLHKFAVITDTNVRDPYAKPICEKMIAAGYKVDLFVFPAGEKSKTRLTKERIEDAMLEKGYRRDCAIIAVGGGVVTDLAGFVAGTYGRGVPFVNYATTLLAAADASVGGKTAVDTPLATNLIGLFNQPQKVYIDIEAWKTLPERQVASGMSETIKHACLASYDMFAFIEENLDDILSFKKFACEYIAENNCKIKYHVVMKDERESGLREVLNLGHTVGRAIETVSEYRLLHGEALAIGMAAEVLLSARLGYMSDEEAERVIALYDRVGLPTRIPEYIDREALIKKLYTDKKVRDGKLRFVLQKGIGDVVEFAPGVFAKPIEESLAREIIMEL
ncbi:MAG: 3-dehydroquinate synthase [Lachnobacterium sp.]|nr:3-dehydroquinate synthase [Lachnobacterium sp.]MDY5460882.1 3-dehydroquinate synthase [Agathobacter sp.]